MKELKLETRISVIKKLCEALNRQYAMNWTNEIEDELVSILEKQIEQRNKCF